MIPNSAVTYCDLNPYTQFCQQLMTEGPETHLESARLIGQRTAELHVVLASGGEDPDFAAEPFTPLYQRSVYQSMRTTAGQVQKWVEDLNRVYQDEPALHQLDFDPSGFEWIDCSDADASVLSFVRKSASGSEIVLVVCNFTPIVRRNYLMGVPGDGFWGKILNSDAQYCGGSGQGTWGAWRRRPSQRTDGPGR
jgi:hypothetical protein